MKVTRNFEEIYREEEDPWKIGNATSAKYEFYYHKVLEFSKKRSSILDIGCGFGVFLSRFRDDFSRTRGIELSQLAIEKGKRRYPFIEFLQGCAGKLPEDLSFSDTIISSDVICYLDEKGKRAHLKWIHNHLNEGGLAFIAAWTPGKKYLTHDELKQLVLVDFKIEEEHRLDSGHSVFLCRAKKSYIAITIDYETWHPIPEGLKIDWEKDVFEPFESLLEIGNRLQIPFTFMAEMGEYFWLAQNSPKIAEKMEIQWKKAIQNGHDVQLHLHPNWLPELGARFEEGEWIWDWSKRKAADYPGDLTKLIKNCKERLEKILKPVKADYKVSSFRAGAYQVQPFSRIFDALTENGILCDTSVFDQGVSEERGYNFSFAHSNHLPYWANRYDPQLKAPPAESKLIEIPVFTFEPGVRWSLDGINAKEIAKGLTEFLKSRSPLPTEWARFFRKIKRKIASFYFRTFQSPFKKLSCYLPRAFFEYISHYREELLVGHDYFVMIGHTKGDHSFAEIERNLEELKRQNRFEFATLSKMAFTAKEELSSAKRATAKEESDYQVKREYNAVMGDVRNAAQSYFLQELIPLYQTTLLDLGCGAGYWSDRIAKLRPWMHIMGVDIGEPFIQKAREKYQSERIGFQVEDFASLSFEDETFDCIYADNTLEHSFDVDASLAESFRVLKKGGSLIAALPSDARNPKRICDNHTWKTVPHEVGFRLEKAGFAQIEITEVNTRTKFCMAPYAPSNDLMMYIKAWKSPPLSRFEKALQIMDWVYRTLKPEDPINSTDLKEILSHGKALCIGYSVALGKLFIKEGYKVQWLTMLAKNHPRGRGEEKIDSHEAILVEIDGKEMIFDPTANTVIPHSLKAVLKDPALVLPKQNPDTRYRERRYDLYDSSFWYERVTQYAIRDNPDIPIETLLKVDPCQK